MLAFLTIGVTILFPIAYSGAYGGFSSSAVATLVYLAAFAAVAGACLWLAYRVQKPVVRHVPANGSG